MELYNPYGKMIKELEETAVKENPQSPSPKKIDRSRLKTQSAAKSRLKTESAIRNKLFVETAEQIQADKEKRKGARAHINQNRLESSAQAIKAEEDANAEYVYKEQVAFENHLKESAVVRQENGMVWEVCNAEALERSRFILGAVTQNQIDRQVAKLHHTKVRLLTEQAKQAQIRQNIQVSHVLAQAAYRDQFLLRSRLRPTYL